MSEVERLLDSLDAPNCEFCSQPIDEPDQPCPAYDGVCDV